MAFMTSYTQPSSLNVSKVVRPDGSVDVTLRLEGACASVSMSLFEGQKLAADLCRTLWPEKPNPDDAIVDLEVEDDGWKRYVVLSADRKQRLTGQMDEDDAKAFAAMLRLNAELQASLESVAKTETGRDARRCAQAALHRLACEVAA